MDISQKNTEIINRDKYRETPFELITIGTETGTKMFIGMGNFRLTEPKHTIEELDKITTTWEFTMTVISALIEIDKILNSVKPKTENND